MQTQKTFDNYVSALGKIIGNLHGLELLLRLFLHNVDLSRYGSSPPEVSLDKIKVDDFVTENYFTNYDTLGELVKKYNNLVISRGAQDKCVDDAVVKLRDALAHGRVLGKLPASPLRLYKFGKPAKSGQVKVEHATDFTESELAKYIKYTFEQVGKVQDACRMFCPDVISKPR